MASLLRYSAVAAMVSSVVGKGFGSMPSQTVGHGLPIFEAMATEAPSLELVKRRMEKRALTNICSEWTILGGNGQPQCYNSQTCLFSSVGSLYYEGCGMTSIAYDWITECYNYPKSGTAGPSQTFCDSAYPSCGVFEFVLADGYTYSNFGCSTKSYSYVATLLETSGSVGIQGDGSKIVLTPTATVYVTRTPTDTLNPTEAPGQATNTPTSLPRPVTKKSTPVGAIVGGVVGGLAVIALISFFAWYCLRKRKQDRDAAAAVQQQQADAATAAAYHNTARMSEIDGTMTMKPAAVPPLPANNYSPPEKPLVGAAVNEYRPAPQSQYSSGYGSEVTDHRSANTSPPPVYAHPSPPTHVSSPGSQYTELDPTQTARVTSVQPVSPAGTNTATFMSTNVSELGGGENRMSYQAYHPPGNQPPPMPGMSASTGGINRPVDRQQAAVDMSGAPMSENYRPHEMP